MAGIAVIVGISPLCALREIGNYVNINLNDEIISFEQLTPIENIFSTFKSMELHPGCRF